MTERQETKLRMTLSMDDQMISSLKDHSEGAIEYGLMKLQESDSKKKIANRIGCFMDAVKGHQSEQRTGTNSHQREGQGSSSKSSHPSEEQRKAINKIERAVQDGQWDGKINNLASIGLDVSHMPRSEVMWLYDKIRAIRQSGFDVYGILPEDIDSLYEDLVNANRSWRSKNN